MMARRGRNLSGSDLVHTLGLMLLASAFLCATGAMARADAQAALDPSKRISQFAHSAWRIQNGDLPGLPEAIGQTTDGYLWVGTFAGLVRFDGVRFVPWAGLSKQPLPDDRVFSLLGARDGSLWIGTHQGLARWKNGQLTSYLKPPGRINSIVEDKEGNIWVARSHLTDKLGPLCEVESNQLKCYGEQDGIPFSASNRLASDDSGNFWIAGQEGLSRWTPASSNTYFQKQLKQSGALMGVWWVAADKQVGVWASVQTGRAAMKLHHLVEGEWKAYSLPNVGRDDPGESALFVDRDHTLWVGSGRRGIYRLQGKNADHFTSGDGLTSDAIAGFFQDREGTLWVATSKGIDSFRELPVATFSIREGLSADSVSTVLGARDGSVWIGNSGALDHFKDGKIESIHTGAGLPGRDVTTMFEDHAGRLWLGVDHGLWVYDQKRFRSIAQDKGIAFAITEDGGHNIWVRLGNNLVRIQDFEIREEISQPPVSKAYAMATDPKGGVWLGLTGGELVRYRNGQMEVFPSSPGTGFRQIRALLADTDGSVLGTTDQGLVHWKDGARKVLTSRNGLPCDDIYTLVKDNHNAFWLYAKCGLISIAGSEMARWYQQPEAIVSSKTFDGFDGTQPGITPLQPQSTRSTDGRLWFANDSVLQMIDPGRLNQNKVLPPVHVERIIADRKDYLSGDNLKLPPRTLDIEFDYAALSLVAPQKVRYRYKLEGHDREWQEAGQRRQAFYNDLPPGNYKFRVIGCNNDGLWNEAGATVDFGILPAFYQTPWFFILCAGVTAYLAFAIYRWRVSQVARRLDLQFEERLAERTRIAQDLHDTLLQGVLSASMQLHVANDQLAEDAKAKPLVGRVLELMGRVIDDGRNAVRGLRSKEGPQELDQAFSRVPQELAIERTIDFRVIVEGSSRELHPVIRDEVYRIGREALVNAFRHSGASNIEVELEYAVHQLRVLVRDNGCGIDPQVLRSGRDGHFGLSGMRERAGRIGAKLKVWSREAGGTEVELAVPSQVAFHSHVRNPKQKPHVGTGENTPVKRSEKKR